MGRLEDLCALRDNLATWVEDAPVDRKAALVAQYRATLAEIAELAPDVKVGDPVDEIAQRRAARGAVASTRGGRSGRGAR